MPTVTWADPPVSLADDLATETTCTVPPGQSLLTAQNVAEAPMPKSTAASAAPPPEQPVTSHKKAKKHHWDAAQKTARLYHRSLRNRHKPYLGAKAESVMCITVVPLDLHSDHVSDGGPRFIEPVSPDKMRAFVKASDRHEEYGFQAINKNDKEHPANTKVKSWAEDTRFQEGCDMLYALREFAHTPLVDDDCELFNPDWTPEFRDWPQMQAMDTEDLRLWWLDSIYGSTKAHRPHTHAFLSHANPLQDDKLTTGEIALATGIIACRRCFHGFNDHRYIPVTIFSASFRSLRVVQVWDDKEDSKSLHVRWSPIMDFTEGVEANLEAWTTLLCWMMGDQLDVTMSGQASKSVEDQGSEAASTETVGEVLKSQPSDAASGQPENDQHHDHHSDTSAVDSDRSDTNSSKGSESDDSINGDSEETLSPGEGEATV